MATLFDRKAVRAAVRTPLHVVVAGCVLDPPGERTALTQAARTVTVLAAFTAAFIVPSSAQGPAPFAARRDGDRGARQIQAETSEALRFRPGESTGLRGPYLGQEAPGEQPSVFAPGVVSTRGANEFCTSFSPDGKEVYFNRGMTIMVSRLERDGWTAPEPAAFNGAYGNHEAHLAFDNTRLFFGSSRPPQPYGVWLTERSAAGWSEPRRMWDGMYATSSRAGNVYFGVEGPSGAVIVRVRLVEDRYGEPQAQRIGFADVLLSGTPVFHPGIAPDETYLVFDDNKTLYVSFRAAEGSWAPAVSLSRVLGERTATIPSVSPDGRFLFYAAESDVHWVSTAVLGKLKPRKQAPGSAP